MRIELAEELTEKQREDAVKQIAREYSKLSHPELSKAHAELVIDSLDVIVEADDTERYLWKWIGAEAMLIAGLVIALFMK